jgi:hypothetical protein
MRLSELLVGHNTIRHKAGVAGMMKYVLAGGRWNQSSLDAYCDVNGGSPDIIYIVQFPDGMKMIHDGHHRCLSTYLAGRDALYDNEYIVRKWSYESYLVPNLDREFVTPFDPRTEVRLSDFKAYKGRVLAVARKSPDEALAMIEASRSEYCEPRRIWSIAEFAAEYIATGVDADAVSV